MTNTSLFAKFTWIRYIILSLLDLITRVIRNAPNNLDNSNNYREFIKDFSFALFCCQGFNPCIIIMELDITDGDLIDHLQYQVSQQQKPKVQRLANQEKLPRYLLLKNQRLSLHQFDQITS